MEIKKVLEDKRGKVWRMDLEGKAIFIATTKKGYARGGDIPAELEFTMIIEGAMEVRRNYPEGEKIEILNAPVLVVTEKDVPHVFIALKNSTFIEWFDLPLPPYGEKRFYEPYRKLCR